LPAVFTVLAVTSCGAVVRAVVAAAVQVTAAAGREHLIRRQCYAYQQPGHLVAGLPGWLSLARIVFHRCSVLYGQNQATAA
jgi:hypothetical protein